MQTERLNTILTLLANAAVLIGLIIVAIELRQNEDALNASTQFALSEAYQNIASRSIDNSDFAETLTIAFSNSSELTPVQIVQVLNWIQEHLTLLYAAYELREQGIISEETWQVRARLFMEYLENPSFEPGYISNRNIYPEEFFLELEAVVGYEVPSQFNPEN